MGVMSVLMRQAYIPVISRMSARSPEGVEGSDTRDTQLMCEG